jgi:hygromycin-B 4-O-kinase
VEIGRGLGRFYSVTIREPGAFLDDGDETSMRALLPFLFEALDAMRLADLGDGHGFGLWHADGNAPFDSWRDALLDVGIDSPRKRTHGWRERLAASPTGDGPFREAHRRLEALADEIPNVRHLVHGDLLNRNVLVSGDRISAVLDWGASLYGDFLLDVAWLIFWWPWYPAWRSIDVRAEALLHYADIGLDVPEFDRRLQACLIWIGLDGQAYQAFKGSWSDLEQTAARTMELARLQA